MTAEIRVIGSDVCKAEEAGNKAEDGAKRRHTEGKENNMREKKY